MARTTGRHRISRRTKIATGALGLALAVGGLVVVTTTGNDPDASAAVDKSQFVDITKVKQNVNLPRNQRNASRGTFTVNCGRNENGHFNADNFIAQPGVKMGAEHLHDYVGNLTANADSNNKSLAKSGTTCKNGDKSAYFWPVVRINTNDKAAQKNGTKDSDGNWQRYQQDQQDAAVEKREPRVDCKDVASELPEELPDAAQPVVEQELQNLEAQKEAAEKKLENAKNPDQEVVGPLTEQRKQSLDKITQAVQQQGQQPKDFGQLAPCGIKQPNNDGVTDNGDQNNEVNTEGTQAHQGHKPGDKNLEIGINKGTIQRPVKAELTFRGNPNAKVKAMPKFLRVLTGDAKVSTNGPKNARKVWTCSGFEDKVLMDKYPICPEGSQVMRIHDFPSCWDGKNVDSANHRDHIIHREPNGTCKRGFVPVPELRISLTYDIPRDIQLKGQYTLDSFAQEKNNPASDHNDFANVMSERIMFRLVNCINKNKTCRE